MLHRVDNNVAYERHVLTLFKWYNNWITRHANIHLRYSATSKYKDEPVSPRSLIRVIHVHRRVIEVPIKPMEKGYYPKLRLHTYQRFNKKSLHYKKPEGVGFVWRGSNGTAGYEYIRHKKNCFVIFPESATDVNLWGTVTHKSDSMRLKKSDYNSFQFRKARRSIFVCRVPCAAV